MNPDRAHTRPNKCLYLPTRQRNIIVYHNVATQPKNNAPHKDSIPWVCRSLER